MTALCFGKKARRPLRERPRKRGTVRLPKAAARLRTARGSLGSMILPRHCASRGVPLSVISSPPSGAKGGRFVFLHGCSDKFLFSSVSPSVTFGDSSLVRGSLSCLPLTREVDCRRFLNRQQDGGRDRHTNKNLPLHPFQKISPYSPRANASVKLDPSPRETLLQNLFLTE